MKLTEKQKFTLAEALRAARATYNANAAECRTAAADVKALGNAGAGVAYDRLAAQFDKQAGDCTALLQNQFEDCL